MEALIVIPTYNERENIEGILTQVLDLPFDLSVLVVDDGSPDGTGKLVDDWVGRDKRVNVLHRPRKLGLGSAYIKGFKWALEETDGREVFARFNEYRNHLMFSQRTELLTASEREEIELIFPQVVRVLPVYFEEVTAPT